MSYFLYNKRTDFIIGTILVLLVFVVCFNLLQMIDLKLNTQEIFPIYSNLDKKYNSINKIKLNDVVSTTSNEYDFKNINNEENTKEFNNVENIINNSTSKINQKENFGNIKDYPELYDNNRKHIISSMITDNISNQIINQKTIYDNALNQNYNTVNDIPLLFDPDTDVPNRAGKNSKGYYYSKVKLIEDSNSPLMKLAKENTKKINNLINKCELLKKKIPKINGTFDGYNTYVDLKTDSYANITSIGKSMLSPYTSYPIPS